MLSRRAKNISPSQTLEIASLAKKMKKAGKDVAILAAGEPDFPTPGRIKAAGIKAIEENFTIYTAAGGIQELKEAICEKFLRDNKLIYKPEEVMANCGGKQSLYLAFQCLLDPGDRVIISVPYWNSYIEQVKLAEGQVLYVNSLSDMSLNTEEIEKLSPDAKILSLNSPCNPSGHVIREDELKKLGEIALKNKNLFIILDEVYEYLIYEGKHMSLPAMFPELKERTLIVSAVSKSYSMTGWRLGYSAGPRWLISAMTSLQGHMTSNPSSISQKAALEAIRGNQDEVKVMLSEFARRREYIVDRLGKIPLLKMSPPKGAFYAFIDISKTGLNSVDFANKLLEEYLVAVIPGEAFGMDRYIRLSFASSMEELEKGIDRIERFVKNL